jgi:hypothetical protein
VKQVNPERIGHNSRKALGVYMVKLQRAHGGYLGTQRR